MLKKFNTMNYLHYSLVFFLTMWGGLLGLEAVKKISPNQTMLLAAKIELLLHIFSMFFILPIYFESKSPDKSILRWLVLANIFLFVNDLTYYISVYLSNKYMLSASFFTFLLGYIPYLIWIFSIILFLLYILKKHILNLFDFYKALPIFILMNLIITFLFFSSVNNSFHFFSWENISHVISFLSEFFIFDLALVCFIYSEEKGFSYLLLGLLTLISGDFFVNYSFISQTSSLLHYGEMLWFLGLILMMHGLAFLRYNTSGNINSWLSQNNSIKNNLAFWSFVTSIISFLFFFTICYFVSANHSLLLLPLIIMMYSVIVVVVSIQMGKKYESPFRKLTDNVRILTSGYNKQKIDESFALHEFVFLQKFITEAFEVKEQKERAQQALINIAAQVAHDIRSPLAAINTVMSNLMTIPERQRIMIRNATTRINDIANNLLSQSKLDTSTVETYYSVNEEINEDNCSELIFLILDNIISEKRFEYYKSSIQINLDISSNAYNCFANVGLSSFKRVLSNLINNSVEAVRSNGVVNITMNNDGFYIRISIEDNGCGIPNELLPRVIEQGFSHNKKNGAGYGLSHAKQYIHKIGGAMDIRSAEGIGTIITISLPHSKFPVWFCDSISIGRNHTIIILDDDISIQDAWKTKFKKINHSSLWYYSNSSELTKNGFNLYHPALYLIDFELVGENKNGLDLIEEFNLSDNAILVTSCFEDSYIRSRCVKNNIKILPKAYVPYINIQTL